jgi:outer membrane protein assembly factor BamB
MQPISRTLRVAAFSLLTALALPTWAQTQAAPILWQTSWSGDSNNAGVTLANDTLFLVAGPTLYALDATTGDFKWNATAGTGTSTTPVIVEDMALTIMGQVIAWNASTGAYLWTSDQPMTPNGEAVSVDLKSRTVFVGVQSSTTFPAPLVALHLDTGVMKWQGVVGNLTNVGNGIGPAVVVPDHELVCILTTMSYLVCYDIATGTVAWETCIEPEAGFECAPSNAQVSGLYYDCGALVVAQYSGGGAFDVSNGTRLWVWYASSNYAVVSSCTVFTYTNNNAVGFSAVHARTGATLWTTSVNWQVNDEYPVIAGGNVLVLPSNMMYMFNMTTGAVTFTASLPSAVGYVSTQMQYRKGKVYLTPANSQTVYALSTLPTAGVSVCIDPTCQQCPESFHFPTDQCTTTADGGSAMRQCSGTEFTVNTYDGNSLCAGQPARVASYVLGQDSILVCRKAYPRKHFKTYSERYCTCVNILFSSSTLPRGEDVLALRFVQ